MATPAFLQFAQADPGPGFSSALTGGIQTYGALEAMHRAKLKAASDLQTQQLSRQGMIEKLREQPLAFKTAQDFRRAQMAKLGGLDIKNPLALHKEITNRFNNNPDDTSLSTLRQMLNKSLSSKGGISISTGPTGETHVTVGGQQSPGDPGLPGTLTPVPGTKAGRGEKGGTFVNPQTGQITSTPTLPRTTVLQQSIMGEKQVKRSLLAAQDVLDGMKSIGLDYFSPRTQALAASSKYGGKYIFPEAAKARSGILAVGGFVKKSAERYMKAAQVLGQKLSYQDVKKIITPDLGETIDTYKHRVSGQLAGLNADTADRKEALRSGTIVGKTAPLSSANTRRAHNAEEYIRYGHQVPMPNVPQATAAPAPQAVQPGVQGASVATPENIAFTAKKYGITPEEVVRRMRAK